MKIIPIIPWENPLWDIYVSNHRAAIVYHTSTWIRIVSEVGAYPPCCFAALEGDEVVGVLPMLIVRSRLTGNRLVSLPFSDECYVLADSREVAKELLQTAEAARADHDVEFFEMRGTIALRTPDGTEADAATSLGYGESHHFDTFQLALSTDTDAVYRTLHKKAVRPTIKRSFKLGVTVRVGSTPEDISTFYRLYCLTRRKHGIPPQPKRMFDMIFDRLRDSPSAILYIAEHEGRAIGASVVLRYNDVVTLKYEVTDESALDLRPVYAMLWKSIEDAAIAGARIYDFGRTEKDNEGLASFKKRWGTERIDLAYYYSPPAQGLSTVDSASLKYRLFTATFKRLPIGISVRIGERLFKHFG